MKWIDLEKCIAERVVDIETWFQSMWQAFTPPFMSSVDIRYAGYKLSEVDTNVFPAGFNNLNPAALPFCVQALQAVMTDRYPPCKRILIIPEAHTRNQHYQDHLMRLLSIFKQAGFQVELGHWQPQDLPFKPIYRIKNRIVVDGFDPCLILLNNDLSEEVPALLEGLEQAICPDLSMGWRSRRKSRHFVFYQQIVNQFATLLGCDPWLFCPEVSVVSDLDFMGKIGIDMLKQEVEVVLERVRKRYQQYKIRNQPFVVIKADNGTYGMGVMSIKDPAVLLNLNRKQRTKMSKGKGGHPICSVLIQEGIYTIEQLNKGDYAEPVTYMIGPHVVGGFYRVHGDKKSDDNLNTPGMYFEPLPFHQTYHESTDFGLMRKDEMRGANERETGVYTIIHEDCERVYNKADRFSLKSRDRQKQGVFSNKLYMYGVMARLGALAAGMEAKIR